MLELHDHVLSAECHAVRLLLGLLGTTYVRRAADISLLGGLPVLEDRHVRLQGMVPCLLHVARTLGPEWHPPTARITDWLGFAESDLTALSESRRVSVFGHAGEIERLNSAGRNALRRLEDHLTDQRLNGEDWIAGRSPTIADIAIFPSVMLSHDSGIGHEDYPAINLWQRRLRRLPGFEGMPGIPDYF